MRLSNSIRKFRSVLLLVVTSALSSVALADTISQSLSFRLNASDPSEVLHFQSFDSSLGSLESVGIEFDATRRHDWAVWNFSGKPATVAYNASLIGTSFTLNGVSFNFLDSVYGSGTTEMLNSVTLPGFSSEALVGRNQFLAGLDPAYPSAFNPTLSFTTLTGNYLPGTFSGDLNLSYDPGTWKIIAGNFLNVSLVDVAGSAKLTYTFKTSTVPDSPMGLSVAALWLGVIVIARVYRAGRKFAA